VILRRVHPEPPDGGPAESIDVEAPDARARIAELYAPSSEQWLRLNLVHSVDGSAKGADGTSHELSSAPDRAVLGAIRSLSDLVLIGAETLRAERYLLPQNQRLAVVTGSGDLSGAKTKEPLPEDRILVVGPAAAEARARETFVTAFTFVALPEKDDRRLDVRAVIAALRDRGAPRIVCEGGPHLAQQLLRSRLVDEICLTTSPKLVGGAFPVLGTKPLDEQSLELRQLLVDDAGSIYARWYAGGRAPIS
jgi:5-amino-6-(5-phosphoribosylamino)uracil reductase